MTDNFELAAAPAMPDPDDMHPTIRRWLERPCEICGVPATLQYEGHVLCPRCAVTGCGKCWKALLVSHDGRTPWRMFQSRWVCPSCGWKGRWRW